VYLSTREAQGWITLHDEDGIGDVILRDCDAAAAAGSDNARWRSACRATAAASRSAARRPNHAATSAGIRPEFSRATSPETGPPPARASGNCAGQIPGSLPMRSRMRPGSTIQSLPSIDRVASAVVNVIASDRISEELFVTRAREALTGYR